MAKLQRKAGATSRTIYVFLFDANGSAVTGLLYNTSGLTCKYVRSGGSVATVTLATLATPSTAWSSGGFVEVDTSNTGLGLYRLDVPDAVIAAGVDTAILWIYGATLQGGAQCRVEFDLTATDWQDSVRGGMTALPAAAAGATGGLINAVLRNGTAQAGAAGSITLDAGASSVTDYYKGAWVMLCTNTGAWQVRLITAYNGSTKVATIAPNWATAPDNTSTFMLLPSAGADVELWGAAVVNALSSGRVDVSVGAYPGNTPQTGDNYARIGAPVGASISADIAAIKADTASIITTLASLAAATATAVWGAGTRSLTTFGTLVADTATAVWASVTRALTDKAGFTLTSAYDPAKTAAQAGDAMALTSGERTTLGVAIWASATRTLTSFGTLVSDIWAAVADSSGVTTLLARLTSTRAGNLDHLNADISTRSAPGDAMALTSGERTTLAGVVWASASRTLTSFGTLVADIWASVADSSGVTTLLARLSAGRATNLDNLDVAVSTRLATSSYTAPDNSGIAVAAAASASAATSAASANSKLGTPAGASVSADVAAVKSDTGAIKSKTDNLPASPAATGDAMTLTAAYNAAKTAAQAGDPMTLTSGERDLIGAALLQLANGVEPGITLQDAQRIQLAVLGGKLSGAGTATIRIRDVNDTKDRVVATVDPTGDRSAVTLDAS